MLAQEKLNILDPQQTFQLLDNQLNFCRIFSAGPAFSYELKSHISAQYWKSLCFALYNFKWGMLKFLSAPVFFTLVVNFYSHRDRLQGQKILLTTGTKIIPDLF